MKLALFVIYWVGAVANGGAANAQGLDSQIEKTEVEHTQRALIGITGLGNRKSGLVKKIYQKEDNEAIQVFVRTAEHYGKSVILAKEDSTFQNFAQAIYDFENDPSIQVVDIVMNMHGQPGRLCFWEEGDAKKCKSMEEVISTLAQLPSGKGIGPKKLRALYTDACHSQTQLPYWKQLGVQVMAGARENDVNHTSDIRKFTESWIRGKTFERSIRRANSFTVAETGSKIMNRLGLVKAKADSTKVIEGDANLTIRSASGVSAESSDRP